MRPGHDSCWSGRAIESEGEGRTGREQGHWLILEVSQIDKVHSRKI